LGLLLGDNYIRFAGFATKTGKLIAYKYGKETIPLLTSDETQLSVLDTALKIRLRKDLEPKIGKAVIVISLVHLAAYLYPLYCKTSFPSPR
jgi:hypothetical protein